MKLILIIALVFPMSIYSQNWKDLKKAAKKVNKELKNTSKQVKELSESDAAAALKETLNRGVEKGVDVLSLKGGFYNNLNRLVFLSYRFLQKFYSIRSPLFCAWFLILGTYFLKTQPVF